MLTTEPQRLADQLRQAFAGDPWYGPSLRQILDSISSEQASARPMPTSHSIWALVLHIEAWIDVVIQVAAGSEMPKIYGTPQDWPAAAGDWSSVVQHLFESAEHLARAIETFPGAKLEQTVPNREYTFYHLFHDAVQHSVYHAGQIAMLKSISRR